MAVRALLWAALAVGAAPPEWAVSGKWASCPPAACWTGLGTGSTPDQARQAAMADVSRQVRARVRSSTRDSRWEEDGRSGEAAAVQSEVRSDERLDGVKIVQQAQDGSTWYALATLDRSDLAAPGRAIMSESVRDAGDRATRLRAAVRDGRLREAVDELAALGTDRRRFLDAREKAALGEPEARSEEFPFAPAVLDSFQRELSSSLELRGPDTFEVSRDRPSDLPLRLSWRGCPVPDADLELVDPAGRILAVGRTDSRGEAALRPSSGPTGPWLARLRAGSLPAVERRIEVRRTGAATSWRLRIDPAASEWRSEIGKAVERGGWSISSDRGQYLSASLKTTSRGSLEGISGTVVRMEVRLLLAAGGRESSCAATSTGPTEAEAVRSALRKLDCPPF